MRTILVTGAGGFVGRSLTERLMDRGDRVVALDAQWRNAIDGPLLRHVAGPLESATVRATALDENVEGVIHLATVPGGAAEQDPAASRRVNIDAMYDLLDDLAATGTRPRFVYASSIAVLGDPLPAGGVDDATPLVPRMVYGAHKAMMEIALALESHRGSVDGVSLRLPGILARPAAPSGMKSAFMSDLFHALLAKRHFVCPVSRDATIWAQSIECCVDNFVHALDFDTSSLPPARAVTLPALRMQIGELADVIGRACGTNPALVDYECDAALEATFGAYPPLTTGAVDAAGFVHDGDIAALVARVLAHLQRS